MYIVPCEFHNRARPSFPPWGTQGFRNLKPDQLLFLSQEIEDMIWSDPSLFIQIGATDEETLVYGSDTLDAFDEFRKDNGFTWSNPDHAVLWTM